MEIRHLQTFLSITELEGFTKAAEHLGYAQSTITSHIQIIEDELGQPLFDRLGKKIVLTNVGRELVPYAREMVKLYKDIKNITSENNGVTGDLIIGAGESLTIYRLGKILKEFKTKYPKVNIILKQGMCSELRNKVHTGEIDFALTLEPELKDNDLIFKYIKDEKMVIIGGIDSELEFLTLDNYGESAKEGIIYTESGCAARIAFENYLKEMRIRYLNPIELSSIEAIKKCAINGLGISYLPYYSVKQEVKEGDLKILELMHPFNSFKVQLLYHKKKNLSKAMIKFIEILEDNCSRWD